ncbi:PREDICTED: probable LRR receptor-like serine/threonine-protein kinase At2g16250 isoform X2 [Lupinus angustifolius]|uniref:probable LRR receptor-like serine/threonine-protein kinase At2g16250 isoform X2 n=1 Tax=Lupinus angustifolius TaxID=3871 RepID=UPI00092EB17D|nr:PREDICTED: probable LRR receptor-like serine/threonine-protein kinase At2g16250 isoform X2 [Lupinus angustifolius]
MLDRRSIVLLSFWSLLFLFLSLFQLTLEQNIEKLSSPTERVALLQLRGSLGLRSREWPIKPDPCLFWVGITCHNGSVVGINISGFRRTRLGRRNPQFAVDALANFTFLQSFNASNFMLPGPIPDWFGLRLGSLRVLDLRSCSIVGAIPGSVGNLTSLTNLYLSDNKLTGTVPDSIGQLLALSVLDLSQNSLTGSIPTSLTVLVNLSSLDMSSNFLSGPIPPGIGGLSKLQYLNLSSNDLTSLPSQIGGLGSLVDLDLGDNSFSGGVVPSDLKGLRNLQRMMLGNSMLGGPLPGNLFGTSSQLRSVVLRQNNFTGSLPLELWSLPKLTFLDASANNFGGLLPNSNSSANGTIAVLNISHNVFYGNLTHVLGRFGFVDLSNNYFEGRVLNFIHNASLASNCLQNTTNQKTTVDCASFYAARGLTFDNFGRPNATNPRTSEGSGESNKTKIILAAVLGGLGLIACLVLLVVLLLLCARKRGNSSQRGNGVGPAPAGGSPPHPTDASINFSNVGESFTYLHLLQATGDFNDANLIKHGHSGDLFKGVLDSGIPVVIKRIDMRSTKKDAYLLELEFFSKVSHQRFVPLLGHCLENENEKFLVYKNIPNGDLSNCLYFKKTTPEDGTLQSLDWITRLKIATGAAEALSYLHHECIPPHVHRDVQASSILLDDKYEVRLGSLSEVCVQEGDSHQSRRLRFLLLPQSSDPSSSGSTSVCAYDVYCFGKVLLGLVTGKLGLSASSDGDVKEWLDQVLPNITMYDKDLVTKIVDPSLFLDEDFLEEVWAIAIVARSCLNPKPAKRPPMRYVLKALENPLKVVREESSSSARLRATSSRGSWNATLFGSWRHSSSDAATVVIPPSSGPSKVEGTSSLKLSGTPGSQSPRSFHDGGDGISSSQRRYSKEIFSKPSGLHDVERVDQE